MRQKIKKFDKNILDFMYLISIFLDIKVSNFRPHHVSHFENAI